MAVRLRPQGVLIAIEGIDGAGKTTQAGLLADQLERLGLDVVRTKEPTDGQWGRLLRESAATGRLSPEREFQTFVADRREHVSTKIAPALARGAVVIVDRYYFSTAAYQGARGMDPDEILRINEEFAPQPDVLALLVADPSLGLQRIRERGDKNNLFEREDDLRRSANIFAQITRPYLVRVDARRTPLDIEIDILAAVYRLPQLQAVISHLYAGFIDETRAVERTDVDAVYRIAHEPRLTPDEQIDAILRYIADRK